LAFNTWIGTALSNSCSIGGVLFFISGVGPNSFCRRSTWSLDDLRHNLNLNATLLSKDPPIFLIDGLIDSSDAQRLVEVAERPGHLQRGSTLGLLSDPVRTQFTYSIPRREAVSNFNALSSAAQEDLDVSETLLARVAHIAGLSPENAEPIVLQRTRPGEFYKVHHDYIERDLLSDVGPRVWTFLVYLSTVEKGGSTRFPLLKVGAQPKLGRTLAWPNTFENTFLVDYRTYHTGRQMERGLKYSAFIPLHSDAIPLELSEYRDEL